MDEFQKHPSSTSANSLNKARLPSNHHRLALPGNTPETDTGYVFSDIYVRNFLGLPKEQLDRLPLLQEKAKRYIFERELAKHLSDKEVYIVKSLNLDIKLLALFTKSISSGEINPSIEFKKFNNIDELNINNIPAEEKLNFQRQFLIAQILERRNMQLTSQEKTLKDPFNYDISPINVPQKIKKLEIASKNEIIKAHESYIEEIRAEISEINPAIEKSEALEKIAIMLSALSNIVEKQRLDSSETRNLSLKLFADAETVLKNRKKADDRIYFEKLRNSTRIAKEIETTD